jgi:hypothetical protein
MVSCSSAHKHCSLRVRIQRSAQPLSFYDQAARSEGLGPASRALKTTLDSRRLRHRRASRLVLPSACLRAR